MQEDVANLGNPWELINEIDADEGMGEDEKFEGGSTFGR